MNLGAAFAGGGGKRRAHDFYPTPAEAVAAILPLIADFPLKIWEPACGDGAMVRVLKDAGIQVVATDLIDRGYEDAIDGMDFLLFNSALAPAVVTNPPFNLAEEFIRQAHRLGVEHIALLLRSTFWHAAKRAPLFAEIPPAVVHPLLWRLDFDGRGSPTMDCSWLVWRPGTRATSYQLLARP